MLVVLITHRVIVTVSMMMRIVDQHHPIGETQQPATVGLGQIG